MFLFDRIDFVALVGLWVQTFVAWVFVAILGSLRSREHATKALTSFVRAFVALALSLSIMSVRFFTAHDTAPDVRWADGETVVTVSYGAYLALKVIFGGFLVRGCLELRGEQPDSRQSRAWLLAAALLALVPLAIPDITPLLAVQAPVMMTAAVLALRALPRATRRADGYWLVRVSLYGLLASWTVHGVVALTVQLFPPMNIVLSLNSLIDLAVQLALGVGLVIGALHAAHERMRVAEQERERLERELARDEKLRALGTLVSGVAHELNNPLTVILGYAELMGETPTSGPMVRIISEQAERCRGIVRNLSALAGQASQSPEKLDVRELVERVLRGMAPQERARGKRLEVGRLEPQTIHADRIGLEQVLSNLVANALDASPEGGAVTVETRAVGDKVEFVVADEGSGVPQALRARLFEPFFTTKRPGEGTGLGLAIAHAIVRGHGGAIWVDDGASGRGAAFRFVIPDAAQPQSRETSPARRVDANRRLLVIDDDRAVRAVLRRHAEQRGWSVDEMESADHAAADPSLLERFDVVLCDLRMPGMGGIALHDELLRTARARLERMVFATGDLASDDAVEFSQRCRRPLVQKPFVFDELFDVLERCACGSTATAQV